MGIIFDVPRLQKEAQALRNILLKYKEQETEAEICLHDLNPIIQQVLDGEITAPIPRNDIPCGYSFAEGSLRPIPRMHSTYADFAIHISGQDTDEDRAWFAELEKEIKEEKNNP